MRTDRPYDWPKNQSVNFSHHNHLFLKPVPREGREAFGYSELPPKTVRADVDTFVGIVCVVIALAAFFGLRA